MLANLAMLFMARWPGGVVAMASSTPCTCTASPTCTSLMLLKSTRPRQVRACGL
jgi:hypothetical protein